MSLYLYDANGYLGECASLGGWAKFREVLDRSGAVLSRFSRDGHTDDLDGLRNGLEGILDKLDADDRGIAANLIKQIPKADLLIVVTEGVEDTYVPTAFFDQKVFNPETEEWGVWRTIRGRRIFIPEGMEPDEAFHYQRLRALATKQGHPDYWVTGMYETQLKDRTKRILKAKDVGSKEFVDLGMQFKERMLKWRAKNEDHFTDALHALYAHQSSTHAAEDIKNRKALDHLFENYSLESPRDMMLYRGINGVAKADAFRYATMKQANQVLFGHKDTRFVPTSSRWDLSDKAFGGQNKGGVLLQVFVPKGAPLVIPWALTSKYRAEAEVMLDRGATMSIVAASAYDREYITELVSTASFPKIGKMAADAIMIHEETGNEDDGTDTSGIDFDRWRNRFGSDIEYIEADDKKIWQAELEKHEHTEEFAVPALYAQVQRDLDALENNAQVQFVEVINEMKKLLGTKVQRSKNLSGLMQDLKLPYIGEFRNALRELMRRSWSLGQRDAKHEVRGAVFEVEEFATSFTPKAALKWLRDKEIQITGIFSDNLTNKIKGVLVNALKVGATVNETVERIYDLFEPFLGNDQVLKDGVGPEPYQLKAIIRTTTTEAYNHGRLTEYLDPAVSKFLNGVRYSAILDNRTTEVCRYLDGKVFKISDPDLPSLTPPNHYNCRSILVPVVVGSPVNAKDYITPAQKGRAKQLADAKFLSEDSVTVPVIVNDPPPRPVPAATAMDLEEQQKALAAFIEEQTKTTVEALNNVAATIKEAMTVKPKERKTTTMIVEPAKDGKYIITRTTDEKE